MTTIHGEGNIDSTRVVSQPLDSDLGNDHYRSELWINFRKCWEGNGRSQAYTRHFRRLARLRFKGTSFVLNRLGHISCEIYQRGLELDHDGNLRLSTERHALLIRTLEDMLRFWHKYTTVKNHRI